MRLSFEMVPNWWIYGFDFLLNRAWIIRRGRRRRTAKIFSLFTLS